LPDRGSGISGKGGTGVKGTGVKSGTGVGASGGAFVLPAKVSKPKPRRWMGALLDNVEEFARGFGPGVMQLGKSAYNDADRLLLNALPLNNAKAFQLDDVGKAIGSDYKKRYGDLGQSLQAIGAGDFGRSLKELGQFKDQLATRPLDFILDAATLATLGGASVGTVPAKMIQAGVKVSPRVAARAGFVARNADNLERARLVYGISSKEVRAGEKQGLVRGVREVGTKAAAEGRIKQPLLRPNKTNTVLNKRDVIVERALGSNHVLNKAPMVGLYARAAAQSSKRPVLQRAVLERTVDEAQKNLQWLNKDELTAWAVLHQGLDPQEYATLLDREAPALKGVELELNRARAEHLRSPDVVRLTIEPNVRVQRAVKATKSLADDVMQPIMENVVGMRASDLLDRRLMPQRVIDGAYATTTHPTDVQFTPAAVKAQAAAAREADRRAKLQGQVASDLDRARADRARVADRLRRFAQELMGRARAQESARRALIDAKGKGRAVERAMTKDEALADAPERVQRVPAPGHEPSAAEVEQMIAAMRNKLVHGKYAKAGGALNRWLATIYNELRYNTPVPDAAMKRAEAAAANRARAAQKRRGKVQRGAERVPGRGDVLEAIDRDGAWSQKVASMIDRLGPAQRKEYWKMVKQARGDDARFVQQWPDGSLERKMAAGGFHPTDRYANPLEDDALADLVGEWLDEQVGEADVLSIALGNRELSGGGVEMDPETAQALIAQARHGDPDLPSNPTDDEIADGIALAHLSDESAAGIVTQKQWVEQTKQAFLHVFENFKDQVEDPQVEFGRVRGRADLALAEKLGIRNADAGVEPTGRDWANAIEAKLTELGFTDEYRQAAAGLTQARRNFDELGTMAFRSDRFVPDPDQVDFGTMLEFVPEIDPALRAKLAKDAGSLNARERAVLRSAARKLEAAANRVETNGSTEAVLRRRLENLSSPGARERRMLAAGEKQMPMPLKGNEAPDGTKYRASEFVDPATGGLYRDAGEVATAEGSYLPHVIPKQGGLGGGGLRASSSVKNRPQVASSVTAQSTGRVFAQGTYENEAIALLDRARGLIRAKYAGDLFDAAIEDMSIPFDELKYAQLGGPREWVVANPERLKGIAAEVEGLAGMFEELKGLLPEEQVTEAVARLKQNSLSLVSAATKDGTLDQLRMIPRSYYDRLVGDLTESNKYVRMLIDRPLDVFRTLVLFSRPAYYVNNIVGQNVMLAVREGGPMFVPQYIRFLAHKNQNAARALFRQAVNDDAAGYRLWDAVFEKHAQTLHGASAGQVETSGFSGLTQRLALSGHRKQQILAAMLRSPRTANELGAILSDDIPRQFRFIRLMQPHIKAARQAGMDGDDAAIAMRLLDDDAVLAERVIDQTLFDLVDYRSMSPFEKRVMRRIVPFYGWMRGITGWTLELGYNHPQKLLALALIGQVGSNTNEEWNRRTPLWMQGAFRVGGERNGVQRIVNTQGLNPLGTMGDVAMLARGVFSDDPTRSLAQSATLGQINPFAQAFAAAAFNQGKELGTPYPMLMPGQTLNQQDPRTQWRGWPMAALGGFIASTPQATLYAQHKAQGINEANGGPSLVGTRGVYQSPFSDYVYSYLGLPVRNVNMQAALTRRQKDEALVAGEGGGRF